MLRICLAASLPTVTTVQTYCYLGLLSSKGAQSALLPGVQEGEDFEQAAEAYVKRFLKKGVPSLFAHMSPLYRCASLARISALLNIVRL